MKIVDLNQVTKSYAGDKVLEGVSMQIMEGERVGLIGRNGEGKSTILKLIAGMEMADSGLVTRKKDAAIGMLRQIPEEFSELTVIEVLERSFAELLAMQKQMVDLERQMAVDASEKVMERYGNLMAQFAEQGGYEMQAELGKVVAGLGLAELVNKKWQALSGGEKTKTALGALLLEKPELLLLDEPTNHLDLNAVIWLTKFLQSYKGAVLVVSHDRYFLDEVVTKMIELENKELITYRTNFSGYLKEREERLLREFQAYKDQQKKIKKMKQAIKQLREWGARANPPNDAFFRRAKNMERMLDKMEKVKRPVLAQKEMNLAFEESKRSGDEVASFEGVSKRYGGKVLLVEEMLSIRQKDRVAIVGDNGTGKSTLLKLLVGAEKPDAGTVKLGSSVKLAYLSQQMEELDACETVIEAFRDKVRVTEGEARNMLAGFMFYQEMVFRKVANLSGGERMRLRLARFIHQPVNTLVLDEPTNHLDIASREVLEEALRNFKGTIITVSHDRYFIDQICSKVLHLHNGRLKVYSGNYTYFAQKVKKST